MHTDFLLCGTLNPPPPAPTCSYPLPLHHSRRSWCAAPLQPRGAHGLVSIGALHWPTDEEWTWKKENLILSTTFTLHRNFVTNLIIFRTSVNKWRSSAIVCQVMQTQTGRHGSGRGLVDVGLVRLITTENLSSVLSSLSTLLFSLLSKLTRAVTILVFIRRCPVRISVRTLDYSLRFFEGFFSPFKQMPRQCLKLGYDSFREHPYQFVYSLSASQSQDALYFQLLRQAVLVPLASYRSFCQKTVVTPC
jgi:hypothetical protein